MRVAACLRAIRSAVVVLVCGACSGRDAAQKMAQTFGGGPRRPDEVPKVINGELPFRYPAALYSRRVQGNVTLRLFIDTNGDVRADSTRVEETSGYAGLDSAALKGAQELHFVPAKLRGEPMSTTVLFPVYFRHPEAHPLPGDTILTRSGPAAPPGAE